MNIAILEKSHNSITISWEAGLNGGSEQHFKVLYRIKGNENYQESQHSITGLKTGQSINYTIHGLYAKEEYEIMVVAINQFRNGSQSAAAVQTVITEGNKLTKTSLKKLHLKNIFWNSHIYVKH